MTPLLDPALAGPLALTVAAGFAGAVGMRTLRRRRDVDRALHELRRPLQTLALSGPRAADPAAATPVELALGALEDLDAALRGRAASCRPRPVSAQAVVCGAIERWRGPAARAGKALALQWEAGSVNVHADPLRLGRALDNLLANAIEHGGLRVNVSGRVRGERIRLEVADRGEPTAIAIRAKRAADRGHGLSIVAGIAREHGGRLALARSRSGTVAILELPLVA